MTNCSLQYEVGLQQFDRIPESVNSVVGGLNETRCLQHAVFNVQDHDEFDASRRAIKG